MTQPAATRTNAAFKATPPQRVLIAGCGYVGSQLAQNLAANTEVIAVRRQVDLAAEDRIGAPSVKNPIRWLKADLTKDSLSDLPRDVDVVVFAAAPRDSQLESYQAIYERALERTLEHMLGAKVVPRIILASSTSVYPQNDGSWVDETSAAEPEAPTSRCIRRGEQMLARINGISIRLGGIYGPQRTSFIEAVRRGTVKINPDHSAYTNRIHRDDAASIIQHLMMLAKPQSIYNAVDCEPALRADVATWLAARLGVAVNYAQGTEEASFLRGNKRVSNARLLASGYQFSYPTYREGYAAMLADRAT